MIILRRKLKPVILAIVICDIGHRRAKQTWIIYKTFGTRLHTLKEACTSTFLQRCDGPITAIYGGRAANDEAKNTV